MDDDRVMHGMGIDDAYRVERVLAEHRGFKTELVTLDGAGPFVRKKIPLDRVNRGVWAALPSCGCLRLPQVVANYELPDTFVAVCSYVPGETLSTRVRQRKHLPAAEAVRIAHDLCEAADALHAHGVVHCDVAPANIVLAADGAHLIDMGIARMVSDPVPAQTEGLGTRGFASPEQLFDRPDARADVYAIGRVLGFMVTGARPDDEGYAPALADTAAVPPALCAIIEQASAYDRNQRYASAAEMMRALDGFGLEERARRDPATASVVPAPGAPVPGTPIDGAPAPAGARGRSSNAARDRRDIKFTLLALAVVMALAAAGIIVWETVRDQGASELSEDERVGMVLDELGYEGPSVLEASQIEESLQIVETWWREGDEGAFPYVVGVRNTSRDLILSHPAILITARDGQGTVISVTERDITEIGPGEVRYYSGYAGDDSAAADAVDFDIGFSSAGSSVRADTGERTAIEASDISVANDAGPHPLLTGTVTTTRLAHEADLNAGALATVVLRDDEGDILYGITWQVPLPAEGETEAFSVPLFNAPDYADIDVYVMAN